MLSCRTHLSMEMCVGMDVSGGSATHHGHTFPEKPENSQKNKSPSLPPVSLLITSADVSAHQAWWRGSLLVPAGPQASCWAPKPFGWPWNGTKPGGSEPEPRQADPRAGGCHQGSANKLLLASTAAQHPCPPHSPSAPTYPSLQTQSCTDTVAITNALFRISALR